MTTPEEQLNTQLTNIQTRTGKSIQDFVDFVQKSGLQKHGEIRDLLKQTFNLGYGDANTLAHVIREQAQQKPELSIDEMVDGYYSGKKESLRPIHDKIMAALAEIGPFEISPKKTYLSFRRKKQFIMVGPASTTRVEVGINLKEVIEDERLTSQPAKSMCDYIVKLTDPEQVDELLISWIEMAYNQAG